MDTEDMVKSGPPSHLRMEDYDAIQDAVMETERGRWFLREYAQRNRSADTGVLLSAIQKLHHNLVGQAPAAESPQIKFDLIDMANAIAETKLQVSAMGPENGEEDKMTMASAELDAIVRSAEKATGDILNAAEQIQEIAWNLREQEVDDEACDSLDKFATDIYTACSFQDLTGQRTDKVISVLQFVENRITAMMEIWELDESNVEHKIEPFDGLESRPDAHLLNGPQLEHKASSQNDIDDMMSEDMFEISVDEAEQIEPEDIKPRADEIEVSGTGIANFDSAESDAPYSVMDDSADALPATEFESESEPEPEALYETAPEPEIEPEAEPELLAETVLMPEEEDDEANLDDVIQDGDPASENSSKISAQELQALTPSDETIEIGTADEFAETPSSIEQMHPPSLDQMAGADIHTEEPDFESKPDIPSGQDAEDYLAAPLINTAEPGHSGFENGERPEMDMSAPVAEPETEIADPGMVHHGAAEETTGDTLAANVTSGYVETVSDETLMVDPVSDDAESIDNETCLADLNLEQRQVLFS